MKKLLLLLLLASLSQLSKAQAPNWLWAENSNGGDWENGIGLSIDTANHLYMGGRVSGTVSFGGGSVTSGCSYSNNPFNGEFDTSGNAIWMQSYDYSCGNDYTEGFYRDNFDNTYTTGIIGSNCCGMFVTKYDKNGTLKWPLPLGSNSGSAGLGVAADNTGSVYVCGTEGNGTVTIGSVSMPYTGGSQAIILFKLDSTGTNCIWGKSINGATTIDGDDQARDVIVDNKGYIYIIGDYSGSPVFDSYTAPASNGNKNFFLAKYDTAGNEIWVNTVNDAWANDDFGGTSGLTIDSCGNLYVTGLFSGTPSNFGNIAVNTSGGQDMFVARCDNNGNWQWVQTAGGSSNDQGEAIAIDKNSDIYVAGYSSSGGLNFGNGVSTSSGDIFIAKYSNGNGAAQWAQSASANSGVGAITVDKKKYVYVFGSIAGGTATFGSTTLNLSSTQNLVLAKLDTVPSRTIVPVIQASYCPGSVDTIPYTITGTFNAGNVFTVQLSDTTGSFVTVDTLGSLASTSGGKIVITIPSNIPSDSTYLIRILSSDPAASSFYNGCGSYYVQNVYLNNFYVTIGSGLLNATVTPVSDTLCSGGSVTLQAKGGTSYLWSTNATSDTINVSPTANATYTVLITNGGCTATDTSKVFVNTALPLQVYPPGASICNGQMITLKVPVSGSDYVWTPSTSLSATTGDSVVANPTADITYTVTGLDSLGCSVTGTESVNVGQGPNQPVITPSVTGDTLFSSAINGNQWYVNGQPVGGATDSFYVVSGLPKGDTIKVAVTDIANGCSTTSDAFITGINLLPIINNQLSIYPNPTNGLLNVTINATATDIKDWSLRVTDVLGRTLYTRSSLTYYNELDLSGLPGGVYFITVINKTSRVVVPIVKQN